MNIKPGDKIGVIGVGNMGHGMAGRLIDAGFQLTIHDLVEDRTVDLSNRGAKVVHLPKEVAAQSDVIIAAVPNDADLESIVFGESGILASVID